ncbi:MAG: phytanoyl-CoA dioxygenase family protein [Chloroflexota bacterium]
MNSQKREQFMQDGYYLFENILEPEFIQRLTDVSDTVLAQQEASHFEQQRTTGSMVLINWEMAYQYQALADLIAHPNILAEMTELGFPEPKFGHGRIISKPPHSPPLFWHEDGRFWDDPVSYTTQPIQCFLMIYLTDTTPENGCLRVIPGTHRKRHALHDQAAPTHTDELRTYANPNNIAFQHAEGEIDVPIKAGDVVMGYGNIFHASHANQTDQKRTVLTMWYYPDFVNLPERSQATVALAENSNRKVTTSPVQHLAHLDTLKIIYEGDAEPIPHNWVPGEALK